MRRIGNLWSQIVDPENLKLAIKKAARGKKDRAMVRYSLDHTDEAVKMLQAILNRGFKNAPYTTKVIYEPKVRTIYILPFFPDRIIHHAIVNVLEPVWDSMFIADSYSCRKNKGQHAGSTRCMEMVRKYNYCLKCDVSKFYPSINHAILKQMIRRKIKDKRVLALLDEIIDSADGETNVPIGNLLSQWFGNIYLNRLDMLVKHELHHKAYIRYCDDFVLFSNDKHELWSHLEKIKTVMNELQLKLSKADVFPVKQGVDFLGYRHFKHCVLVRKSTAKRIKRRLSHIPRLLEENKISIVRARSQVASALGWLKHANAFNLRKALNIDKLMEATTVK